MVAAMQIADMKAWAHSLGIDPLRQAQDLLFRRLAAVRYAFKYVASIINWSGLGYKACEYLIEHARTAPANK